MIARRIARFTASVPALLAAVPVLLAAAPARALDLGGWLGGLRGSGDLETREVPLEAFQRIELDGAADLEIRSGETQSVRVILDDNLMDNLVLEVRSGTLEIDWKKNCRPSRRSRIEITTPGLESLRIDGAGDVRIVDFEAERFRFEVDGAGDLDMAGAVGELQIRVDGAGDVDARQCEARHVSVAISGAGDVSVTARESLDARIDGVGDLTYYGHPSQVSRSVNGIGQIRSR